MSNQDLKESMERRMDNIENKCYEKLKTETESQHIEENNSDIEEISLTDEQQKALDSIQEWLGDESEQVYKVGGYAGTGKTFLIGHLSRIRSGNTAYVTFTGKASSVLRTRVIKQNKDYVGTIHGLIYYPREKTITNKKGQVRVIPDWRRKPNLGDTELIVIDEGSMVSRRILEDILEYNKPILIVGDSFQLPPVGDNNNPMEDCDVKLEHIHRQAAESPIIQLSQMIRRREKIENKKWDDNVRVDVKNSHYETIFKNNFNQETDVIICAFNYVRVNVNKEIRKILGYTEKYPMIGERVICLKNNRNLKIFNGMMGTVTKCEKEGSLYMISVAFDEFEVDDMFSPIRQFGMEKSINDDSVRNLELFDWAYCVTCHKAQGSEFENVMIPSVRYRPGFDLWDKERWLYTAVTRAKTKLLLLQE